MADGAIASRPDVRGIRARLLSVASILLAAAALATAAAAPAIADETSASSVVPASVGADGRVQVVVVAPITVPVGDSGLLSSARLAKLTAPTGLLTQELDAVTGTPVTLAIDPRIIASIRVLGSSAPTSAQAWLNQLASLDNETFPLAYADADPVAAGQAGRTIETAPQSFAFAIDSSDFGAAATASPSPSPSATAAQGQKPPLPQSASDVLAWDWKYSDIAWPADDTVVTGDLPRLATAGYGTVLVSDGNTTGSEGHVRFTGDAVPRSLTGLVADSALSAAGSGVADAVGPFAAETATIQLTTALQAAAADDRGSIRVMTLARSSATSLSNLNPLLATISASATIAPLSTALAASPASATIVDKQESANRLAQIGRIADALAAESAYSSVAVQPVLLTGPRQLEADALLSTGWIGDDRFASAVSTFVGDSRKLLSGVTLVTTSTSTALGSNPLLPVTIRNSLDVAINVEVITRSRGLNLSIPPDKRRIEVTVQPDSTQTVRVPTQSVSNGKAQVQVNLLTATGVELDGPVQLTLDVQAGWETAGTLVVVVLVLGVFGFGVTRRILRRRRGEADA